MFVLHHAAQPFHMQGISNMNKLQQIETDASATIDCHVAPNDPHVVRFQHAVKVNQDSDARYNLRWNFDFAGVKQGDILMLAARSMLIREQSNWRKAKDRLDADVWQDQTFVVTAMLAEGRKSADPATKVENMFAKMNVQDQKDFIAKHMPAVEKMVKEET